jgi:hypothetical protein
MMPPTVEKYSAYHSDSQGKYANGGGDQASETDGETKKIILPFYGIIMRKEKHAIYPP